MEFTLNTIDVEFSHLKIATPYVRRDPSVPRMVFVFTTQAFTSMGIIAQLKKRPEFISFLRQEAIKAIRNLSYADFCQLRDGINGCHSVRHAQEYNRVRANNIKLEYSNSDKTREGEHLISFHDSLEGWTRPIATLNDLIAAFDRINQNSIRK